MINHGRTLLLNINGTNKPAASYPAEEFVPIDYMSLVLPQNLLVLREILFGINPDRAMLNYRLRQYLTLVHSTEFSSYLTDLDSRVTYWPNIDTGLYGQNYTTPIIQQLNGSTNLHIIGDSTNFVHPSTLFWSWNITVTDSSNVTINKLIPPVSTTVSSYSITNGLSSPVSLIDVPFQFNFNTGVNAAWNVQILARPTNSLSDIVALLDGNSVVINDSIFGNIATEPYKTFRNLWLQHNELPYRLTGIILALVYATNNILLGT